MFKLHLAEPDFEVVGTLGAFLKYKIVLRKCTLSAPFTVMFCLIFHILVL